MDIRKPTGSSLYSKAVAGCLALRYGPATSSPLATFQDHSSASAPITRPPSREPMSPTTPVKDWIDWSLRRPRRASAQVRLSRYGYSSRRSNQPGLRPRSRHVSHPAPCVGSQSRLTHPLRRLFARHVQHALSFKTLIVRRTKKLMEPSCSIRHGASSPKGTTEAVTGIAKASAIRIRADTASPIAAADWVAEEATIDGCISTSKI